VNVPPASIHRALLALAGVVALAGCGSGGAAPPKAAAPLAAAPEPVAQAPPPAPGPADEVVAEPLAAPPAGPAEDPLTVVIDPGGAAASSAPSLVEAAAAERERRKRTGGATVVIDDKNLADYADVPITIASEAAGAAPEEETVEQAERRLAAAAEAERYWRARVREQRLRWRNAVDAIARLEKRVGELRSQFYAEDDPYYRDSQIKPAWDLALAELGRYRGEVADAQVELANVLTEGRESGAMPGWLREGLELEPDQDAAGAPRRPEGLGIYEPEDPEPMEVRDTDGGDGGA